MFKRRKKLPIENRIREFFAPRRGWTRVYYYWRHRMQRLPDSPSRIALGFACGVYTSFTPFFGFHFVVAAVLAWMIRGNVFASAVGTFTGNPLTFPFIVAISLEFGEMIMGSPINTSLKDLGIIELLIVLLKNIDKLVIPYFVGGFLPGMATAVASFFLIRPIVSTYQKRRRARMMSRAKNRIAAQKASDDAADKAAAGTAAGGGSE